ncbi:phage tail baseplate protein, partial [Microcystis wesenbergii]
FEPSPIPDPTPPPPTNTPLPTVSPTILRVLDIPLAYPIDTPGLYAFADGDANWRNANLYISTDLGVTYSFVDSFVTRSTFGTCQTIFNDTSVDVRVSSQASLASISEALFLEGRNRSLIGSEIVDFQNATLTGNVATDKIYQLTAPFTRGIRGTPQTHAANENFYLLSGYKLNLPAQRSDIGKTFYFKAVSPGQTLADVAPVTLLFQGKAFQVVIDDFSPRQGAIGTTVTIIGLGFTGATAVSFNNVPAQSFTVVNDTTLTAVVDTGTTTGKIRITAPLGIGVSVVDFTIATVAGQLTIQDEGNLAGARPTLNFIGANVTAVDNPSQNRVDVTITPPTPTIQDEGILVSARPILNFIGPNVTAVDNSSQNRVDVTLNKEDRIFGEIEQPTVKEYTLEYFVSRPYTIKNLVIGTSSGTATVLIQINGQSVSGLNVAVTPTQLNVSAGNNLAVLGSTITLRVLSVNNATNLKFNLIYDYA